MFVLPKQSRVLHPKINIHNELVLDIQYINKLLFGQDLQYNTCVVMQRIAVPELLSYFMTPELFLEILLKQKCCCYFGSLTMN